MSCDVGEVTERLENELCYDYNYELCSFSNLSFTSPMSQLILQPFHCFIYVTAHSPTLPLLIPMSQLIIQPFFRFSYVTSSSLNSPCEPAMVKGNNVTSKITTTVWNWLLGSSVRKARENKVRGGLSGSENFQKTFSTKLRNRIWSNNEVCFVPLCADCYRKLGYGWEHPH